MVDGAGRRSGGGGGAGTMTELPSFSFLLPVVDELCRHLLLFIIYYIAHHHHDDGAVWSVLMRASFSGPALPPLLCRYYNE